MENDIEISVVIPVYNVEQYIKKCIDSILYQSFDKYEIILVDDGSIDKSAAICDEYKQKDCRIKVIHQENKGLSEARNIGIDNAKGKYITFIDSDDYIDKNYLSILYSIITTQNADIVMCDKINTNDSYEINKRIVNDYFGEVLDKEEVYKKMLLESGIHFYVWARLYNIELFKKNRFPKDKIYEDVYIVNGLIEDAKKIVVTNYNGYYYLRRYNSISHGKMTSSHMDLIESSILFKNFMMKNYPNLSDEVINGYIRANYTVYKKAVNDNKFITEANYIRKNILSYIRFIVLHGTFKNRVQTLVLLFGNKFYKLIYSLKKRIV